MKPLRDRKYLDWLRTQRCLFTGFQANDSEAVDPCHIGSRGKGVKSPDNEAIPLRHTIHAKAHNMGEIKVFRFYMPDDLFRECLRAYARQLYQEWHDEHK